MDERAVTQNPKIAANIAAYGWHCLHIAPSDGQDMPFSYSVGFTETFGAPEVLVFGLPHDKAHAVLSACNNALKAGHPIAAGIESPAILSGGYTVAFKAVRREFFGEYLGTAQRYYGDRRFEAVVMFLPDRERRFPWQAGYASAPMHEAMGIV